MFINNIIIDFFLNNKYLYRYKNDCLILKIVRWGLINR